MFEIEPRAKLEPQFSSPSARAMPWQEAGAAVEAAQLYRISTVRPDGRPHVTPLVGVWVDGALVFATGPNERKGRNLAGNPHCVITTGCNSLEDGLDIVLEGDALRVTDDVSLRRIAGLYDAKYAPLFHFDVRDGAFIGDGGEAWVYQLRPVTAFGFGRRAASGGAGLPQAGSFSQTRWRF
jgi:Pyridoxamine 5'-phosphate oxidase